MKTRQIIIAAVGLLFLGFAIFRVSSSGGAEEKPQAKAPQASRYAKFLQVENRRHPIRIPITGNLRSPNSVELYAEVNGILRERSKPFREGIRFRKGQVMLSIDSRQERMDLKAQRSNLLNQITQLLPDLKLDYPKTYPDWEAYASNFAIDQPTPELPEAATEKARFFLNSKNLQTQYYQIKALEDRLQDFTLTAPITGTLAETSITSGALVRPGQKLGTLVGRQYFEMKTSVSAKNLRYVEKGSTAQISPRGSDSSYRGQVIRIGDHVEQSTQTVPVFIEIRGENLREGTFMEGHIRGPELDSVFAMPRSMLQGQDSVFVVEGGRLSYRSVDVAYYTGNTALLRGLSPQDTLLGESIRGAYAGMPVNLKKNP